MTIELNDREFRLLLDMVYIGNWILNSNRELPDRIEEYDDVESKVFSFCENAGMHALYEKEMGIYYPSRAFEEGGIQEAIAEYENSVFFENLAEELAMRDLGIETAKWGESPELTCRIEEYIAEFSQNGVDNLVLEK